MTEFRGCHAKQLIKSQKNPLVSKLVHFSNRSCRPDQHVSLNLANRSTKINRENYQYHCIVFL